MVSAADALTTVDDLRIGLAAVGVTVALLRWRVEAPAGRRFGDVNVDSRDTGVNT